MSKVAKRFTVKEFDILTRHKKIDNDKYHELDELTFDLLEQFVLDSSSIIDDTEELAHFMSISNIRGIGKVIRLKNYVGLLVMKNGTEIEILPKIYSYKQNQSERETKRVLLEMLKYLPDIPYKKFNITNLDLAKNNLLEIFIKMFINEVQSLVKKGLKLDYEKLEGNELFYKGRLDFPKHIRHNLVHRERFYITYDKLDLNRIENRLLKTTLLNIKSKTKNLRSKKDISTLLDIFDDVDIISNVNYAFSTISNDRNMKEYSQILKWCKVFLQNKSFTTFSGSSVAYALLFPMEIVYEAYIANLLKRNLPNNEYFLRTQDRTHHLFDDPKRFSIRPDLVIQKENKNVVLDTKWKILKNDPTTNYGISQADMYQMFAYHYKYNAECVITIYPWNNSFNEKPELIRYSGIDSVTVYIFFVNLFDVDNSIKRLIKLLRVSMK